MGLRILVLGQLEDDVRRQIAALGGGAEIHELASGADAADAIRALSADLAIVGRPGALPAFLDASGLDALERRVDHEYLRSVRYRHPLGLALLSVDHVGDLTHTHGAATVDAFADSLAAAARRALREVDILFRPADFEIAVILPETEMGGARIVAERLCTVTASLLFKPERPASDRPALPLKATVSVGLAGCPGDSIRSGADLIAAARAAMETARGAGGDRLAGAS